MSPRFRALPALLPVVALLGCFVVGFFVVGCGGPGGPAQVLGPGDPLPAFDLPALDGGRIEGTSLRGEEPVVLNFWATWCGPCVKEIPTLKDLHDAGGAKVVSIALDAEGAEVVAPFVDAQGIDYPVLIGDLALFQRFGGVAIPFTIITDGELRVRDVHRGWVSARSIEESLAEARRPLSEG